MKKTSPSAKKSNAPRVRGTYASHACNVCRVKRIKCDESKPACSSCRQSGREDECSYTGESARRPRTEAHYEAMRRHTDALKSYIDLLEGLLDRCKKEHGGVSGDSMSYLQFRPPEAGGIADPVAPGVTEDPKSTPPQALVPEGDIALELCVPVRNLKLGDSDLFFYGIAAPWRFAETAEPAGIPSRFSKENINTRYILQLTDADAAHYRPDFDWSRYLPSIVPLDRKEHDKLLDLLFKFFTSWCMRVVPDLFLRDMYITLSVPRHEIPPKTHHYSPMLHNALIALASAFSDDVRIRDYKSRKYFADEAKRLWEVEAAKPNIAVVHALAILASFHSTNGEQTIGYMYFGMSARLSQALGLIFDSSAWVKAGIINQEDMVDRNWAYWTTFTQDVCWSLYVGRDFCVSQPVRGTIPCTVTLDKDYDRIPWIHPPGSENSQPSHLSSTFVASCDLMQLARKVMEVISGLNPQSGGRGEVSDAVISSLDLRMHEWKSKLPPEVELNIHTRATATPHRLMVHLSFWWTFILLHRPFFYQTKTDKEGSIDHVKLCRRAAENIMEICTTWRQLYSLRYVPLTLVQIVFSAGTVFLLLATRAATGLRLAKKDFDTFTGQAKLCVQFLEEMGKSWLSAERIAGILESLLKKQLDVISERRAISTEKATCPPRSPDSLLTTPSPDSTSIHTESNDNSGIPTPSTSSAGGTGLDPALFDSTFMNLGHYGYLGMLSGQSFSAEPFMPNMDLSLGPGIGQWGAGPGIGNSTELDFGLGCGFGAGMLDIEPGGAGQGFGDMSVDGVGETSPTQNAESAMDGIYGNFGGGV
ncbi:hypothetical protein CYLTODRAFT_368800 [Cylindrobasidium torrendii FP15055 ss-10]|uniref:Zn(2)-C6 fungal-type domain-containing protein n=1 Tax=Cylindrobasidium torrendii FP15055 ss-10 TaxID=1314674 RepID=A0A0D7BML7_9AGAR|nr:hypothetical protein CYLTODRAFT_368800 [Cylindrobasidium torrendii FP15055 ss-10]